ncbi:MAG TPA: tetratricopeptide repeat protein [Candidatus Angelobacter sp.]
MADPNRQAAEEHYYRALDFFGESQHEQAAEEYRKAIELDCTFTDAMHGLVRVYQDMGRLDDAIPIARMIAECDPDDILAHTSLSIIYQKKGMIPEAEAEANQARVLGWKHQLKGKTGS